MIGAPQSDTPSRGIPSSDPSGMETATPNNSPNNNSSSNTTTTNNNVSPLRIDEVRVCSGRLICRVSVDPNLRWTTPELANALLTKHPTLAIHSCHNDTGAYFGDVIARTSIPHLLEHLTIDLMAHAQGSPDDVFTGWTQWEDEERGSAQVQIAFTDDLVALRALRDAVREIAEAMMHIHHA